MNALSIVVANALLSLLVIVAPAPNKPADFQSANLFANPDFEGSPCYSKWDKAWADVICNAGASTVWLNHNNRAGDPAVSQAVTGLTIGAEYELVVGWRGGDHGPIHGVSGARPVFAIDLDGQELRRLSTSSNFTAWMVNDVPDGGSPGTIRFKATKTSHTLRFRGEVGADGDVLIDWVQLKPARMKVCHTLDQLIRDAAGVQALVAKLSAARSSLNKNKASTAVQQLQAALNMLSSSGLPASRVQSLRADITAVIQAIQSGVYSC